MSGQQLWSSVARRYLTAPAGAVSMWTVLYPPIVLK
jgi:hypothetical protein